MKHLYLLLVLFTALQSAPLVLWDNTARIWEKDSLFEYQSEKQTTFLSVNNFSFQLVNRYYATDDSLLSGNRLMLMGLDSIKYRALTINIAGFFDQRGVYGYNIDWAEPDEPNRPAENASTDLHRAMMYIEPTKWLKVGLGKEYYNWGPLELGGLTLSNYNSGFVGLYQQYTVGPFVLRGLATQLNSSPWGYGKSLKDLEHRFFSTARLEFYRERFGFALMQSAIYAGEGRSFELPYLLPFFPFHYAQMSNWRYGNNGDNSYGGIDFYVNFLNKQLELYGELFIDDIQGEGDEISQSVQNNVAGMAGLRWDFAKGWYGFIEGGQINSFVYNHTSGEKLRYQTKNAFIGSPLGPDQRLLWGNAGYRIKPHLSIDLTGWWRRSGERDISTVYSSVVGTRDDPIPYGIVDEEISGWITGKYRWKGILAELNAGMTYYKNENSVELEERSDLFIGLLLKTGINLGWKSKESE
jgi:hypothetical protein